jgi:hypothetical protein
MDFPEMATITQTLASRPLGDPVAVLDEGLGAARIGRMFTGTRVAVGVGSRKIDGIVELVRQVVMRLKAEGCEPFIVPAMGSHGGATPRGQVAVLEMLGVTERSAGAPIEPSMETVPLGTTQSGAEAFISRSALEAGGIVVINKVGPHTGYSGPVQSGTAKMLVVGMGKAEGARSLHRHGFEAGHLIGELAALILEKAPPVLAVALIEDGHKELSRLEVLSGVEIITREPQLLDEATSMLPRIPTDSADLLVVEEMGKDISGIGMDPLVTGRGKDLPPGQSPPFSAKRLVVLRLTHGSGGNATGIGHADITTRALVDATDVGVTYRNVLTSGALHRARLPLVAGSDREALEMALSSLGHTLTEEADVVWIRNTRELGELEVSGSLLEGLEGRRGISVESVARDIQFDEEGNVV